MKKLLLSLLLFVCVLCVRAQKNIYIPNDLKGMNLNDPNSKWSYARMDTTANFVIFWDKGFGNDLSSPPTLDGHNMTVNLTNLENKLERFYKFYRDTLKFVRQGSNSEKYKMMVMLDYSLEGTAFGGDYDGVIGALWIAPNRVQDEKLNCIAHELGHSFQSQISCDKQGDAWGGCGFFEMASQWMLWQVNPEWIHDEQYHLEAFKKLTHKAFLHLENIYHSPYILEYWGMKRGLTVIGDLFREGKVGEDPVITYKRLFNLSQSAFCDEMFDACRHIVNMDYPRVAKETREYACSFTAEKVLEYSSDGWYSVNIGSAPENYGFNIIPLTVPEKDTKVTVSFKGLNAVNGTKEQNKSAGWRYGFVCVTKDGESIYGEMAEKRNGSVSIILPKGKDIANLYFIVMGAPKEHWMNTEGGKDVSWRYEVKFKGSAPIIK